jgi:prepilin-type N-terminal cleavage/methylation domain-containing protein/prepilin-type processing-associated H-X9-DG protein
MQQMAKQSEKRIGFTLIELLVVISIIALLVTILMPSLAKAKELAKELKCLTSQRACNTAVQLYATENDGILPSSESWVDDILPILGDTQPDDAFDRNRDNMPPALFCPCDPDPFPRPYMTGEMEVTSYMVNGAETDFAMGGGANLRLGLFGTGQDAKLDRVNSCADCMMFGETTNYGKVADLDHPAAQAAFTAAGASVGSSRTRFHHRATSGFFHDEKMNVFYTDGHGAPFEGETVDALSPSLWPGGTYLDSSTAFYAGLSLPTAEEHPEFWGPPYDR